MSLVMYFVITLPTEIRIFPQSAYIIMWLLCSEWQLSQGTLQGCFAKTSVNLE